MAAIVTALACALPPTAVAESGSPDAVTCTLELRWDAKARQLAGSETIAFTNTGSDTLATLWLRLWPNAYGGCRRPKISVGNVARASAGDLTVDCTALPLVLDSPVAPGASGEVSFDFVDTVPRGPQRFGVYRGTALLGTAIPVVAVTDSRGLHLEADAPLGESMYSLSAAWNVSLILPSGLALASTGTTTSVTTLLDGEERHVLTAPAARDFAMVIGAFTIHTFDVDGTSVRYFEPPRARTDVATVRGWIEDSFSQYGAVVGAYTAPELDVVGLKRLLGDGMEYPEMVMTELVRDTVSHEVAHQWFYSMAGNNQALEPWLDESFTEYLSETVWGENTDCDVLQPFAGLGPEALDAPMSLFEAGPGSHYYGVVYAGGPCVLERLRVDWGDLLFDSFLRGWFESHRDGVATTGEFKAAVRASAPPGFDADSFFAFARLTSWPG
jgi:hypothetical protein